MEVVKNSYSKNGCQDSRSRLYGGNIYGSIHWVPVDISIKQHPKFDIKDEQDRVMMTDYINALPGDVIVGHVFDKMPDSKSLFNCSMVSKRFTSIVPDTPTVTLKIPYWRPVCRCHPDPTARPPPFYSRLKVRFMRKLCRFIRRLLLLVYLFKRRVRFRYPDAIRTKPPAVKNFLKKFSCIESLSIELSFTDITTSTPSFKPLLRWKFDKHGFVFVSYKSREVVSNDEGGASVENVPRLTRADVMAELISIRYHFMDAFWRLGFFESIHDSFPYLKNVRVVNCLGQGLVEMDGEDIDGVWYMEDALNQRVDCCMKLWHLPIVKLPLSGCVMKEVTVCVFKQVGVEDDFMTKNAFDEDEFCELARVVVKKDKCFEVKISASESNGEVRLDVG